MDFYLLGSVYLSFVKDSFTGHRIPGWQLFSFNILILWSHFFCCLKISVDKSAHNLLKVPLYVTSLFYLAIFKLFWWCYIYLVFLILNSLCQYLLIWVIRLLFWTLQACFGTDGFSPVSSIWVSEYVCKWCPWAVGTYCYDLFWGRATVWPLRMGMGMSWEQLVENSWIGLLA